MPRLPVPGGDDDVWGNVLNDFLSVEYNGDGTFKNVARPADVAVKYTKLSSGIPASDTDSSVQTALAAATAAIPGAQKAAANGVASLDGAGKVTAGQLILDLQALILSGRAITGTNVLPPGALVPFDATVKRMVLRAGTAPTGSSLTVEARRSGTLIAAANLTTGTTYVEVTGLSFALSKNDQITFNVTAVGSTFPGSDIAVALLGN
jgi:hypothetical protein